MTQPTETELRERLQRANAIRNHRARLKRHMAQGTTTIAEVLRTDDRMLESMRLADLLAAVPGMGQAKVHRALDANRLGRRVTLANISSPRREELLDWLEAHHPRVGTGRMTKVQLEAHIAELTGRVEGLETLLAGSNSTSAVDPQREQEARAVERDQLRPSPAWERD